MATEHKQSRAGLTSISPGDVLDGEVEDFIQASLAHKVKGSGDQVVEYVE